jgi:hypothetical protein
VNLDPSHRAVDTFETFGRVTRLTARLAQYSATRRSIYCSGAGTRHFACLHTAVCEGVYATSAMTSPGVMIEQVMEHLRAQKLTAVLPFGAACVEVPLAYHTAALCMSKATHTLDDSQAAVMMQHLGRHSLPSGRWHI